MVSAANYSHICVLLVFIVKVKLPFYYSGTDLH